MNDHTADTVGVDISKARLDAHGLSTGEAARFANIYLPLATSRSLLRSAGFTAAAGWSGRGRCQSLPDAMYDNSPRDCRTDTHRPVSDLP